MDKELYDDADPERHRKRVDAVLGVSSKIKKLANKKRQSATKISTEEKNAEIIVRF